jgi:hypothetical protein
MGELTLKNGKFYRDGEVVKPEFGNKEQIALMEQWRKELEKGLLVRPHIEEKTIYNLSVSWECLCGVVNITKDFEDYENWEPDDDDIKDFIGDEVCCESCDKEYELHITKRSPNNMKVEYRLKPIVHGQDE